MALLDPQTLGILGAAGGLLQASGPSPFPVGTGQALNQGLLGGMRGYGQGLQFQGMQQQMQFREQQMRQMQEQARAAEEAQRQQQANLDAIASQLPPELRPRFYADPKGFLERKVVAPGSASVSGFGPEYIQPDRAPKPPYEVSDMTPEQARRFMLDRAAAGSTRIENNVGPTGIDYGKPPEGMAWARNADGSVALRKGAQGFNQPIAVPISGGPVERKEAERAEAEATKKQQQSMYADVLTKDVDRAVELIETSAVPVTGIASFSSAVPGTRAHDIARLVDTIKANVGFDRLQQMRAASPTGGALGQVSEFENRLLQATIGNLEQSQSKEQLLYNLKRVKDMYLDIVHGPGNRPAGGGAPAGDVSPETMRLIEKYAPRGR